MKQKKARKTTRHTYTKTQPTEETLGLWMRHLFKSFAISCGFGLGLVLTVSLIAYFTSDPNPFTRPLGILTSAITALIGGFAMTRQHRHSALLCGMLMGCLNMAGMLLCSLFFRANAAGYASWISVLLHVGFLLCSIAGAYLGARPQKRKRH